ncbi:hypothetical protein LINPERPRIM_LOCUS29870 [Linum perenne]
MASDPRTMEGPCNSGTDEETVAFRKKRLRRVSFADVEITSVHVFDRDEDLETPPTDALTKNQTPEDAHEPRNEVLGFFKELADGDDLHEASFNGDEVEDEDEAACASKSFLRPFESPGSSVPGSATSLIRSESGDLRTPTNVGSGFGEKTPSNMTTPTDPESLMTLTKATKLQLFSDPIHMIQDILAHLQKLKIRGIFFMQLQQKVCDETSKKMPDRTAEMRNLICKLVFEKARVQKRRNILSIAVQESQMLKSAKALCLPVSILNFQWQASHEKLVASRHEFEALQEKLKNLTQHFRGYCKIGGDTGCSEIIEMLNDQLNKKISFRFLHEGIQVSSSGVN